MRTVHLLRRANGLASSTYGPSQIRNTALLLQPLSRSRASRALAFQSPHGLAISLRRRYSSVSTSATIALTSDQNTDDKNGNSDDAAKDTKKQTKPKSKLKWHWKALILFGELCICDYLFDKYVLGGVLLRTTIAYGVLARVGLDYKLHFGRDCLLSRHRDEDIHNRNAQRVCTMLKHNGGLYLKAGQAVAMQGGVLPEEYQRMFGEMFDDAPHGSWSEVQKVIKEDFGRSVEEVFGAGASDSSGDGDNTIATFEQVPRASASIAQVHFARLADGREVAVKVQRRQIAKHVSWDLWSMKLMTDYTAWATGLPFGDLGEYVADRVMQETDFEHEANNAERTASLIASDPSLRDRVYIPKVYHELSSKRVLTTEWIDGVQLWEKDTITAPYKPSSISSTATSKASQTPGLGLRLNDIMQTAIELFSTQMFVWGFVHCDPHPGNILIRRQPNGTGKPQVVLLDHGLYVTMSDKMRRQYARFWKALVTGDDALLQEVSTEWGMKNANAWADASLMRPYKSPSQAESDEAEWKRTKETPEERKQRMIDEAAAYLGDEKLFPREIVFLERNISIVQGNNRFLGSPVNRIKLIGLCAVRAVNNDGGVRTTFKQALSTRVTLLTLDMVFLWSQIRQYFGYGSGFEEELKEAEDRQMKEMKDAVAGLLGVTVD